MYNKFMSFMTNENIQGHKNGEAKESLLKHTLKTKEYYLRILQEKQIDNMISNICSLIDCEEKSLIREVFDNAIIFHDMGKINPSFQKEVLGNYIKTYKQSSIYNSNHSLLSSYIYINSYFEKIDNIYIKTGDRKRDKEVTSKRRKLKYIVLAFGYIISKHHGSLDNTFFSKEETKKDFIEKLQDLNEFIQKDNYYISELNTHIDLNIIKLEPFKENNLEFLVLTKLLFSFMISCDYFATYDFMNNQKIDNLGLFDNKKKEDMFNSFEQNGIISNIRSNTYNIPINELRGEIFLECEKILMNNLDKNIFFLESPTGSGKTINSMNLMLNFLKDEKINKAYYVFPFNTLSDQTYNSINDIFKNNLDSICKINSVTEIKEVEEDFNKDYLNRLFMNYPINIISHVGFFNILFGTSKNFNFNFYDLSNSVIILDEIQSYSLNIWKEMINILSSYSKLLNIKIIIMSATLPKLDILLNEEEECIVDLLPNKHKYFQDPLFKQRVNVDLSLINKNQTLKDVSSILNNEVKKNNYNKILIEFQDKTNCRNFYNSILNSFPDYTIYELTGDDNSIFRNKVINKTKEENVKIIIVATQVIEAGVDIDMDLGFKEISLLESEEQFLGRINRSCCKENCKAYFFSLDTSKAEFILREDMRIRYNLKKNFIKDILVNKNFAEYYKQCLTELNLERSKNNSKNYCEFEKEVKCLSYEDINQRMKLIDDNQIRIYIAHNKIENLSGQTIWNDYIKLSKSAMDFSEKRIKQSKLSTSMSVFTFNIFNSSKYNLDKIGIVNENNMYYIEDGDKFITKEGKLDRDTLKKFLKS